MDNFFLKPDFLVNDIDPDGWDPLIFSSWYKQNIKDDKIEQEYLKAYLSASKDLQCSLMKRTHLHPGMLVFREDQTCLPFLFSCRHLIELTLKYKLKKLDINFSPNHKIATLWNKIKNNVDRYDERYDELIETFSYTDKNGFGLRYACNRKDGKMYEKGPVSIHSERIIKYTESLYYFILGIKKGKK